MCGKVRNMWYHLSICKHVKDSIKTLAEQEMMRRHQHQAGKENDAAHRIASHSSASGSHAASATPAPVPGHAAGITPATQVAHSAPLLNPSEPSLDTSPERPSQRLRLGDQLVDGDDVPYALVAPVSAHWRADRQAEFRAELLRLLLVCNVAYWAVEHPYFLYFFTKYVPEAQIPSRKVLSGRILEEESDKVLDNIRSSVNGKFGTGETDGWKNIAKASLLGFTVNVEGTVGPRALPGWLITYLILSPIY